LHQAVLFGETQTILHTGKDLPVCKEVQTPALAWAKGRDYPVRLSNGSEQITEPGSGSRWIIRGKGSVYGYAGSLVLVDEAWGVAPEVVEDGLEPTMAERLSPQLVLASTAHRKATSLYPSRRAQALGELEAPDSTLLVEWSATRDDDIEDVATWRAASPHWSPGRQRLIASRLARARAGESLDADETDPLESFLAQYLNVWPARTVTGDWTRLLLAGVWDACRATLETDRRSPVWIAVEDNYGAGGAVGVVASDGERFEVDAWTTDTWEVALADAQALLDARPGSRLTVGVTISTRLPGLRAERAGSTETRTALALFRELVRSDRVVHDRTPDLDVQIEQARVRAVPGGGLAFTSTRRNDAVRAAVWALAAAQHRHPQPAVH